MIERWFPCAEVSDASAVGWGSGSSEKALFPWFAARPTAQAKAAVLTSLLPWPHDEGEQRRLQDLVRRSLTERDGAQRELALELAASDPRGSSVLDFFSGRAIVPLEAARLGVAAHGIDYSPVAALAGQLLAEYPLRDWSEEPALPFGNHAPDLTTHRLVDDVRAVLDEVGRRYEGAMAQFYPDSPSGRPVWGYLWAVTLPCEECSNRFPLTGNLLLRHPLASRQDVGQSYRVIADRATGRFQIEVHEGAPVGLPTLVATVKGGKGVRGKAAACPFCGHVHSKAVHTRLMAEGQGRDELLVVAELDKSVGKHFRAATDEDRRATMAVVAALAEEPAFGPGLSAVPDERIPSGNNHTVRASLYGARTYGDMCNARQTLNFVRLSRVIADLGDELVRDHAVSPDYAACLAGYAGSVLAKKLKYSTRGATLQSRTGTKGIYVDHVFINEASLAFSYDYFEAGLGTGPATWQSLADDTVSVLRKLLNAPSTSRPASISRGTATALPYSTGSLSAVVTDPPYDNMIDYSDASDLFFVWLKRALSTTSPWLGFTVHPDGVQEKDQEAIVKGGGNVDHRTEAHYDDMIAAAFTEARRVVRADGVVTVVFGHGDPDVWHRLLAAITRAGLILTGSWPAKTEAGGSAGSANIRTTLTMSCRPVPAERPSLDLSCKGPRHCG